MEEPRVVLKRQRLKHFLEMTRNIYPDLVKIFYINHTVDGRNLVSYVKGVKMTIINEVWYNITGTKYSRLKVSKGNTSGIQEFNKI